MSLVWKLLQIVFTDGRPRHRDVPDITVAMTLPSPEFFSISSCLSLLISALDYRLLALNRGSSGVLA